MHICRTLVIDFIIQSRQKLNLRNSSDMLALTIAFVTKLLEYLYFSYTHIYGF